MPLDLNRCSGDCLSCIKSYKNKHGLEPGSKFEIECMGILEDEEFTRLLQDLDPDERITAGEIIDPVQWAAANLDWHCMDPDGAIWKRKNPAEYYKWITEHPGEDIYGSSRYHRPYQALMLRCTSQFKVFRIGRQAGKCLVSGTLIQMANGTQKPVEEVQDGDLVVSIDEEYRTTVNPAYRACNGIKSVAQLDLMDGRSIQATLNHPFLTRKNIGRESTGTRRAIFRDEWKPLEELTKDDYIAVPKKLVKGPSPKTEVYEDNDIVFIKVKNVTFLGEKMTWDLTVPGTHNFIANNIVTHNTESLVVSMLWHLFTKPGVAEDEGFKIVVITPYLEQIDLIFTRLEQLIRSSAVLKNSITRSVKAPNYTITLYNKSRIKGFTAGTKSGGNAASVRGQAAHMLVFDEADYLSAEDMDSALAIVINHPLASVWMSSTPTGKREKFYETCFMKDWKEFYFPSQINPLWNEKTEKLFRSQMTEIGYKHEVLAEFGEQEEGVFQNAYVQAAKANYQYTDMEYNKNWTYTLGVDWNDTKNGTTIVVVGFNPTHKKFYIVDRHVVSRDGWTQLAACEKIAQLNRLWHPLTIYLDAGHGGTQWEVLRKFGYDSSIDPTKGPNHPDAKIRNILVRYDFGAKVETRDLWTKQIVKKDAKPFLVESAVRRFEAQDICFPKSDELLEKQLLGYVIDRIGQTGRPVYKATSDVLGDHILDALMLALMGFTMEVSPLGKPKWSSNIAFSGHIGERIDPDIYEGDMVIRADTRHRVQEERERHRPSMDRWDGIIEETSLAGRDLPANHTNKENHVKLWSWNGFSRDEPAPKVRTFDEAKKEARRRMGIRPRMSGRPRRKNI